MRKMIIAAAFVLTACNGDIAPSNDSAAVEPVENIVAPDNEAVAAPVTNASAGGTAAAIPAAFHGRWGMVPADCTSTRGDAKGLLTIDGESLRFYESRAIPRNIALNGPNEWRADLAYSGEGQTWSEITTVTLLNDAKTQRRMGDGPGTYQRCAA